MVRSMNDLLIDDLLVRGLISILLASLIGGLASGIVSFTSTHFLAAGSLHVILASMIIGYIISILFPEVPPLLVSLAIIALVSLSIAIAVDRGYGQSTVVSSVVFISVSLIALGSYMLVSIDPFGLSIIYSTLIRSPFFIPVEEIVLYTIAGIAISIAIAYLWKFSIYMSFDPEYFRFVRGPPTLYRASIYVSVSIASMILSFILGVVPAHVAILAPSLMYARLSTIMPVYPLLYIFLTSIASLFISYYLSIPYGGVFGIIAIISFLIYAMALRGGR